MLKKSLLSLAVTASLVGMSGCNISSTTDNAGNIPQIQKDKEVYNASITFPVFDAVNAKLPLGIDLIFAKAGATDGTADAGLPLGNPVIDALNDLDGGISTLAPIDFEINGSVNPDTVVANQTVWLVRLPNAADVKSLNFPDLSGGYNIGTTEAPVYLSAANYDALDASHAGALLTSALYTNQADFGAAATVFGTTQLVGGEFSVSVLDIDGGTDNLIRISPTEPLDGKTKYIAIITNGVQNASGDPIVPSPDYAAIKAGEKLASSSLAAVNGAIAGWEKLAMAFISQASSGAITADNVAISSAFTTVDPTTVLKSMAYPGYWAPSVITNDAVAQAVINAGFAAANAEATVFPSVDAYEAYLQSVTGNTGSKIVIAVVVANGALTTPGLLPGDVIAHENPRERAFELIKNVGGNGVNQLPVSVLSGGAIDDNVKISQGAIELPQYTVALAVNPAAHWEGNELVGAVLDEALGQTAGTTPPSDVDGAKNVTYRFPFAAKKRSIVAPVMLFEPASDCANGLNTGKPVGGWPVVIMQHGFTSERTGNLINASKVAANSCHAVVAMDLPHHGIAADSSRLGLSVDYNDGLGAETTTPFAAAKEGYIAAVGAENTILDSLAERHENLYLSATGKVLPMDFTANEGGSGTLWIRLDNFQRTRDNMRQGVMDLLNLNASLGAIDLDGDGNPDLDTGNVNYVGHSLGAIVGTTFVAVNNSSSNTSLPTIQKAVLATPGGQLTKLIENSVALKDQVLNGLSAAVGINQGDSALESYMKVLQATIDSADPMNFIAELADGAAADTPTLVVGMYGNGTTNPADLVVPVNANGPVLADGSDQAETAKSPLVGLDPMLDLLGAENVMNTPTSDKLVTRYNEGGHGTFSSAGTGGSGSPSFDSATAFGEMVKQTVAFLLSGAGSSTNTDDVLITDAQ